MGWGGVGYELPQGKPRVLKGAEDFHFRSLLFPSLERGSTVEGQDPLHPLQDGAPYPALPASAPGCGQSGADDGATPLASAGLQLCLRTTGAGGPPAEEEGLAVRPLGRELIHPPHRLRPGWAPHDAGGDRRWAHNSRQTPHTPLVGLGQSEGLGAQGI